MSFTKRNSFKKEIKSRGNFDLPCEIENTLQGVLEKNPSSIFFGPHASAVDLYDEGDRIVAKLEIPELSKEGIKIFIEDDCLKVEGERKEDRENKEREYYCERTFGSFTRIIMLPYKVKKDKIDAFYHNGILTIVLLKHEEDRNKPIKVKIN
ncbi:MAG: Hsp20/alpha crystallin family protein [bacterium]|nr:Hsp20/alpha crystallin family protein [bacterium]